MIGILTGQTGFEFGRVGREGALDRKEIEAVDGCGMEGENCVYQVVSFVYHYYLTEDEGIM